MKNIPNNVEHDLFIEGKPDEVQRFIDLAKTQHNKVYVYCDTNSEVLNFENFMPYPAELYADVEFSQQIAQAQKEGNTTKLHELKSLRVLQGTNESFNFYDYNIIHLGTKWGAYDTAIVEDKTKKGKRKVVYFFNSAWSPFIPLVNTLGQMFPELKFTLKYYEQGVGFSGKVVWDKGKMVKDVFNNRYQGGRGG